MLRIKKDVNMKELEKYGFEYFINGCGTYGYSIKTVYGYYTIVEKENENLCKIWERRLPTNINLDLLFDLIQDGLVEKVEKED